MAKILEEIISTEDACKLLGLTRQTLYNWIKKGWVKPHWEVSCLIRDMFTDEQLKEMGLWYIVTMHEPIKDSDGDPRLLHAYRLDGGGWLGAHYDRPDGEWNGSGGFAFVVPVPQK